MGTRVECDIAGCASAKMHANPPALPGDPCGTARWSNTASGRPHVHFFTISEIGQVGKEDLKGSDPSSGVTPRR